MCNHKPISLHHAAESRTCSLTETWRTKRKEVWWVIYQSANDFSQHHGQTSATLCLLEGLWCGLRLPAWRGFFLPWAGCHWARHPLSQLQFLFTTHSHCCLCPLTRFRTVPGFVSSHFLSPNTWMEPLLHGEREGEKQHAIWVGVWSRSRY